jgi:hypothetical protein
MLPVLRALPQAARGGRAVEGRSFRNLELPVVDAVADVAMDTGRVDFVSVDVPPRELRDERSRIDRALLAGEIAKLLKGNRASRCRSCR